MAADLTPIYTLLSYVEAGTFYDDHDEALVMLHAAWRAYYDLDNERENTT